MPNRLSFVPAKILAKILFVAFAFFAFTSPASAGFMLVQPNDSNGSALAPVTVPPSPYANSNYGSNATVTAPTNYAPSTTISSSPAMATAAPEPLSPVVVDGNAKDTGRDVTLSTAPAPSNTLAPRDLGMVEMPARSVTTTTTVTKASSTTAAAAPSEVVHGFAKMVPLAVALRQILPAGYGFSVDPDVDLGVLISFQGGKPWRDTLRDALDPAGLVMHEKGQMVTIGHVDGSTTSAGLPNSMPVAPSNSSATTVISSQPISSAPVAQTTTTETIQTITTPPVPREIASQNGSVLVNLDAAVPLPAMASYSSSMSDTWRAERGDSLRKIVDGWCRHANVELDWMAEYDYPVQASVNYTGTFEEAVRNILTGFEDAHPQPIGELHTNAALGQRVLVVTTRGNNYTN